MSDAILVELRKTGGIMGADQTLLVRSDGSGFAIGFNSPRRDFTLSESQLEEFRTSVASVDIGAVNPTTGDVRDGFHHGVRIDGRSATVTTGDSDVPDEFMDLVRALDELLRANGGL